MAGAATETGRARRNARRAGLASGAERVSLGEPIALAQWLTLYLQAFDNQPGVSIPFQDLDYPRVIRWLDTILGSIRSRNIR